MAHTYTIALLGPFGVERDDQRLRTDSWPRRARSLLSMLAVAPGNRLSRDEIVYRLWPETTQEAGAANVRYVLHRLRGLLAASGNGEALPVLFEHGWVSLNLVHRWVIDLDRFERLLDSENLAKLEEAAALHAGEPLIEDRYEDWVAPVREHTARLWHQLCLRLAAAHRSRGDLEQTAIWLEHALRNDPLDENALRLLVQALAEAGRRSDALRAFQRFAQQLRSDLDIAPDASTLALIQELKMSHGRVPSTVRPQPRAAAELQQVIPRYPLSATGRLIGREEELRDVLRLGTAPAARFVLLAGEAGMGKTRLLAEIASQARAAGSITLAAGSYEQEGRLPYGPIHDALLDYVRAQPDEILQVQLDNVLPELSRVVPELRVRLPDLPDGWSGDVESRRLHFFTALSQALERICRDRPLVLLLDDLQWADDATLQLLHFLPRQFGATHLRIVGAYRPEEVPTDCALAQLITAWQQSGNLIPLAALEQSSMALLIEDRLGGPPTPNLVQQLQERSAGNPLFAVQLLRLLQQEGLVHQRNGAWELPASATVGRLPPEIHHVVSRRLRRLDAPARELLTQAAVLGREFSYAALEALWDGPATTIFPLLDAAQELRLLVETEAGYAFRHPLFWEALYGQISSRWRPGLHERAGLALEAVYGEEAPRHAAELARHFTVAGPGYAPRSCQYLALAGDSAARVYANEEALTLYRRALELAGTTREAAELREKIGPILTTLGRYDEAVMALELAALAYGNSDHPEGMARVAAQLGWAHWACGANEEGLARVEQVLRGTAAPASPALAALYGVWSVLLEGALRYEEGLAAAEQAVATARAVGNEQLIAQAEGRQALLLVALDRSPEARPLLERAVPLLEVESDLPNLSRALRTLADLHAVEGRLDLAIRYLELELAVAQRMGDPQSVTVAAVALVRSEIAAAQVGAGPVALDQAVEMDRRLEAIPALLSALLARGRLYLLRGEAEHGTRDLEEAITLSSQANAYREQWMAIRLLAQWNLRAGHPERAIERLEPLQSAPDLDPGAAHLWILAEAYLQLDYVARASQLAGAALDHTTLPGLPASPIDPLRVHGMVLSRRRRWKAAESAFEEALVLAIDSGNRYHQARVQYEYGRMNAKKGDVARAQERLTAALQVFTALDARPYIERATRTLAELSLTSAGSHQGIAGRSVICSD